ncbi:hypothetical protein LX36DRAFT_317424 [Colletotrichum falcatum]|nr:hypothetical protein LX36DRAFT_317424 [Colletotrichum falcatum]
MVLTVPMPVGVTLNNGSVSELPRNPLLKRGCAGGQPWGPSRFSGRSRGTALRVWDLYHRPLPLRRVSGGVRLDSSLFFLFFFFFLLFRNQRVLQTSINSGLSGPRTARTTLPPSLFSPALFSMPDNAVGCVSCLQNVGEATLCMQCNHTTRNGLARKTTSVER